MDIEQFDYTLPEELIAQEPSKNRKGSRLMILKRKNQSISHKKFTNILDNLKKSDFLIFNNTRVIPARLFGQKEKTGGKVEILLTIQKGKSTWEALVKPGRRIKPGHKLIIANNKLTAKVIKNLERGHRLIEFNESNYWDVILKEGEIPLPPYIKKPLKDKERYQTIFSKHNGSSAAPTASLHFDKEIFKELKKNGIEWTFVTLHIGPGTFLPVETQNIKEHKMHKEYFFIDDESIKKIQQAKRKNMRIIPVGTTALRTIESAFNQKGECERSQGWTDIFIYPGYTFKMTDGLITNFHLPKSTLLMLVSALAGRDYIFKAYREAIEKKYRFFSFGDCMIIL